jgi:hypothetical protein
MRDYVNETCRNLEFDFEVLKKVQEYQDRMKENNPNKAAKFSFRNGLIYQYVLVFKTLCTLPDNSMSSDDIRKRYIKFFGEAINQPSCARALAALDKIGLVQFIKNPFDKRSLNVKMKKEGKRLQYLLTGSTKAYPSIETAVTSFRYKANANK